MNNKKGFTLIEILTVIIIVAILAAVAIMGITTYLETSREGTMRTTAANILESVRRNEEMNNNSKTEYNLLTTDKNILENELKKSPWGNDYKSVIVTVDNNNYSICIIDENNKGLNATENNIANDNNLSYDIEDCTTIDEGTASEQLINKVGTDGLVAITHPADNTLQIGATSPITEYRYQGRNGCQGVKMTEEMCTVLGGTVVNNYGCRDNNYNYTYITSNLKPTQCTQYGGTYNNNMVNNYVNFNGTDGDYRIIGVFKTEDESGTITNRIKLIKTTNYRNNYWDTSGSNNWARPASLKETLNDTYYKSLTNKKLIDSAKYYLGGYNAYTFTNETMYQYERKISGSDYYYSGNPTSWTGQIGLMYYSDYMYGSADCNGKVGKNTTTTDTRACKATNWLYLGSGEWTITEHSSNSNGAFAVRSDGYATYYRVNSSSFASRPVFYLDENAVILDGIGTIDDPYIFGSAK